MEKRELYRLFRNGAESNSPAEYRTETEAKQQNAAMAEAGLKSEWVRWDLAKHSPGSSLCPCSPCTNCENG